MKFQADNIEYWSQNQVETVFFGNTEKELALLLSNIPSSFDHYLEWNDPSNACVNAIKKIQLSEQELYVQLMPKAAKQLGQTEFIVEFPYDEVIFKAISRHLRLIFQDKLFVKQMKSKKKTMPKQDYSTIKYLNLEGKNLRQLPDYVSEMTALETAKLALNPKMDFQAVCEILAKLPALKYLTYTTEQPIPENIGKLNQLETLHIDGLTTPHTLPESIGQLKKLKYLCIVSHSEILLPETFADLVEIEDLIIRAESWQLPSKFYQLSKLKQLDFTNCRFIFLPPEIVQMQAVNTMIFGKSEAHDFSQILPIIAQMPHLKVLEMVANTVPKEIGLCRQIEEINIWAEYGNDMPLPLPDELFELKQLKIFFQQSSDLLS